MIPKLTRHLAGFWKCKWFVNKSFMDFLLTGRFEIFGRPNIIFIWCNFSRDRYGYAVASALHGVRHILRKDFMLQVHMIAVEDPYFYLIYIFFTFCISPPI